jgi:hypothetical protein
MIGSLVRFEVFTLVTMKFTDFWDVTPCSLVDNYQYFGGGCCLTPSRQMLGRYLKLAMAIFFFIFSNSLCTNYSTM